MNNDYERYGFWFLENQEPKKETTLPKQLESKEVEPEEKTINNAEEVKL